MGRKPLRDSFKFLFLFTTQGFSSINRQYPSLFPNFSKGVVFLMFKKVIKCILQPVGKICCNIAPISWKFRFLVKCLFNRFPLLSTDEKSVKFSKAFAAKNGKIATLNMIQNGGKGSRFVFSPVNLSILDDSFLYILWKKIQFSIIRYVSYSAID